MSGEKSSPNGFTLVELILTILVVSGGLVGLLVTFDAANRGAVQAQVYQTATYLAYERLEQITADKVYRGYAYINAANFPPVEAVNVGAQQYTWLTAINEVDRSDLASAQPDSGYKRVDVTVSWGVGANRQMVVSTILTQY